MNNKLIIPENIEKEQEKDNIVPFTLLPGGKGPKDSENWIADIPAGTVFLCRPKNLKGSDFVRPQFILLAHFELTSYLATTANNTKELFYVENLPFCRTFDLLEIIGNIEPKEEQET